MPQDFFRTGVAGIDRVGFDAGLRAHMQRVFNYMAGGLGITGLVAYLVANTPLAGVIFGTPLVYLVMFAPLVFIMYMQVKYSSVTAAQLQTRYWIFCVLMGLSMAVIFIVFTKVSIARAFFITSATFAGMSLWGYTTKRDLTSMGAFLMMGVLGLVIAGIVNIFLMAPGLQWVTSIAAVVIFTGLTAFNVQQIKADYAEAWGVEENNKKAVFAALMLYLNFINVFQALLNLTGDRRS
jgi:FtsH-binding integral membrane protein